MIPQPLLRLTLAGLMPVWAFPIARFTDGSTIAYATALVLVGATQVVLLRPFIKAAKATAPAVPGGL